jgi:inosose dehydratase
VQAHLKLLTVNNCKVMVYGEVADSIQGSPVPLYKRPQFRRDEDWRTYAERVTAFASYLLKHGVRLAYHHHMGAYVQAPSDIDRLMHLTGPEVGLLFDSGHATFAGGDPVAVLARHMERVCHVHCKDVRPDVLKVARNRSWSFLQSVINGAFTVPGDGAVDFHALLKILYDAGYAGWLVVEAEQDPAVAPSFAYAQKGYQHLAGLVRSIAGGWQEAA